MANIQTATRVGDCLDAYADRCGIGKRQIAPFRMKAEPKWGTRSAMQLIWIFDEIFVRPTAWEATFRQFGIDRRPVLHHRTQRELESVVQLDIAALAELRMDDNLPYVVCRRCDRRKHAHVMRGFVPAPAPTDAPALKSCQYFGDGGAANRAVLISNAVYRAITAAKLRGMEFDACAG